MEQRLDNAPVPATQINAPDHKTYAALQIIAGFALYLLAGTISYWLLREWRGNGSYSWSPEEVRQTAWTIRGFAALLVIGGYAERIVAALRSR